MRDGPAVRKNASVWRLIVKACVCGRQMLSPYRLTEIGGKSELTSFQMNHCYH